MSGKGKLTRLGIIAGLGAALLSGCTFAKYKSAPRSTPGPVMINLPSTEPPVEALVHTVIVYRGPGSWKQDAYWDEYVVTIANRGDGLLTVDAATLQDGRAQLIATGLEPWSLESESRSAAAKGFGFAQTTAVQIGGGFTAIGAGAGVGALLTASLVSGSGAGAAGAAIGGFIAIPAFIGGSVYSNITSRNAIEREFDRRRLVLPIQLPPGQLVQGSLFFRITPAPRGLLLKCRVDDAPRDVVVDLAPLAGLHLKPTETTSSPIGGPRK